MKKWIWIGGIIMIAAASSFVFYKEYSATSVSPQTQYQCPMHPQIVRDKPGTCPICGMTLQPVHLNQTPSQHQHSENAFKISAEKQQILGMRKDLVTKRPLTQTLRVPGRVAFDSELYVAEEEFVASLQSGGDSFVREAILKKLSRLGISETEIAKLKKTKKVDPSLFIPNKEGAFWVYATLFENDLAWITPGLKANISLPQMAEQKWEGIVRGITPILDSATRTAQARIWVENKEKNEAHPETYIDVMLEKDLGEQLSIPAEAIVNTGEKTMVFIDLGEGYLEPREVILGKKANDFYPVIEGVKENETVILSAQFLLDSEAEIQSALKRFGKAKGHQH